MSKEELYNRLDDDDSLTDQEHREIDPHYDKLAGYRFETSDCGFVYDEHNCDAIGLEYLSNRIRHFNGFQKAI